MERLKQQQHRDSTRKNYYAIWRQFNKFFIRLDIKPQCWEDRLSLFVAYLIENQRQASTVHCYISAIKAILRTNDIRISEDQYLLSAMTKACKLKNNSVKTRLPIHKAMLSILLKMAENYFLARGQPFLATLYQTLFLTAYFGLFRISELTSGTTGSHPVFARDVHTGENKKKFLFILCSSKTHCRSMPPQMVKISSTRQKCSKHAAHS